MPVVAVGLNHRSAPMSVLERLSLSSDRIPEALDSLVAYDHVDHCVLLSTCNRVEIYAEVTAIEGGIADLQSFLASISDLEPEDILPSLYAHEGEDAARHLFRVSAGLDSLLVGETEILGQVKRAYRAAVERGTVGRLDVVFRRALSAGKRARTMAGPASRRASTSSATVELVAGTCGGGSGRVVIVGAGSLGAAIARELHGAGIHDLVIVNRSEGRGRELARGLGATFVSLERLEQALEGAAALVCSVSAGTAIVDRALLERVTGRRDETSQLLVVDLGVPRNVDPEARDLGGVRLCDLRDLLQTVSSGMSASSEQASALAELISAEVERYREWEQTSHLSPMLESLVAKGEAIRERELERFHAGANDLTPQQTEAIDQLSRRIVAKLLHPPLVAAKRVAGSDDGDTYVGVMRELFGLDEDSQPGSAPGRRNRSIAIQPAAEATEVQRAS